ncbi:hypothetical protein CDL12_05776 [Handroanthus impetiginosus]|uniref:Uncharacterized protein n=1 Tax=Handroanthus impetiginosus TaxID=429701 RepID=A0A2G9HW17_9LAMI|nr:hypothetical protein CDL12_05776 [Handroanthus impetiginosus]
MAVVAYAAVVSLMHVLDQIPAMHKLHLDRNHIQILRENVSFLQDFLEVHSQRFSEDLEDLARQIAAVADEAEDIIDAHVVDQLKSQRPEDESYMDLSSFCKDIDRVIEKMDLIKKELMMVKEGMTVQEQQHRVSVLASSSATRSSGKNTMVGFDEHLIRIMDELTGYKSDLQILPIVGMGGIGKTTLARNVFENSLIAYHFHVRLWVRISQGYSIDGILLGLLQDMGVCEKDKKSGEDLAELGEKLYKSLSGRKYLIVMDDVWSRDVWNDIKLFFPDNKSGSRIMVTTRLLNVVGSLGCHNPYLLDFLDEDQSWNLFCEEAFTEGCPPELEEIGKKIARSCRGLPLAIVVIGGLLSNSNMTRQYWEFVAENVSSFANSGNEEHCLKILSLSYKHLPIHLKPCFLYMRVFPDDVQIVVSELIKAWVAEGFLKPIRSKTLEEVAEEYLKDLIGRNLILICKWTLNGKIKKCSIHDFLRDLCLRESEKEHFYHVPKVQVMDFWNDDLKKCFLCSNPHPSTNIYLPQIHDISQPTSLASCFVCNVCRIMHPQLDRSRVVRAIDMPFEGYPQPNKLRYLNLSIGSSDTGSNGSPI